MIGTGAASPNNPLQKTGHAIAVFSWFHVSPAAPAGEMERVITTGTE